MSQKEVNKAIFDSSATTYDSDFTFSEIGKLQRNRVHVFLAKNILTQNKLSVLEINCGTGEDALWLAERGCDVIATDASSKMIEVCKGKLKPKSSILNPKFSIAKFNQVKEMYKEEKFDLIFSNFGGLNCVDAAELKALLEDFCSVLRPGGKMVFVIMGRKCWWERVYFLLKGNSKNAFRRLSTKAVPAPIGQGVMQNTFYFSPKEVKNLTAEKFQHLNTNPIGIFIPPSYLEGFFSNKKSLLQFLFHLEKWLGSFSFLSNYADHYFIAFEKNK